MKGKYKVFFYKKLHVLEFELKSIYNYIVKQKCPMVFRR